jgi:hypothetical protein
VNAFVRSESEKKSENVIKVAAHHRTFAGDIPAMLSTAAQNIQRF